MFDRLEMYSLDFEEFLWANGFNDEKINYVKDFFLENKEVPPSTHNRMMELFKEYIVVGGMSNVVNNYINNQDFPEVLKIQRKIIDDYKDDIIKYADENEKAKIRECFLSIPKQLAKENKKIQYSLVEQLQSLRAV